jgi:hypothetical protein
MAETLWLWRSLAAVAVACLTHPAAAQDAKRLKSARAEPVPAGGWAIGYWQGNIMAPETSAGGSGLGKSPRALVVERDGSGTVICRWLGHSEPTTLTQRCRVRKDGITFVPWSGSEFELFRSGPDALQGTVRWKGAWAGERTGMGTQVLMNRLTATPDFGWAVGLWRGKLEGFGFGNILGRTLRITANGARPACYWDTGESATVTTQGCLISAAQISLVTIDSSSVDLQRHGDGLRGTFRTDSASYGAVFQRSRDRP